METVLKVVLLAALQVRVEAKPTQPQIWMPAACDNMSYCTEKHENYPQHIVDQLLRDANLAFVTKTQADLGIRTDSEDEARDCEVDIPFDRLIYEIVDENGDVRVVVQTDAGFKQEVAIERCVNPGRIQSRTRHFRDDILSSYNLQCVETILEMKFLVLNQDWTGLEMVPPKTGIPVSCACQVLRNTPYK